MLEQFRGISRYFHSLLQMLKLVWQAHAIACTATLIITVLQGLLPLASAWVIKALLDWLVQRAAPTTAVQPLTANQHLTGLLIAQAVLMTATAMLPHCSRYLNAELERRLTVMVQTKTYEKINSFSGIAHFENPEVYDQIRLAQQGAEHSSSQTIHILTAFIQSLVTLFSFMGVLFSFNLFLANLVMFAALPQLYAQLKLGRQRFNLASEFSPVERRKFYYSFLLADVQAAKEVRLFGLGQHFLQKLLTLYKRVHRAERRQQQRELRWELSLSILSTIAATIAFAFISFAALRRQLSLGDITLYLSAVGAVQEALGQFILAIAGLSESILFYSFFQTLLALKPALPVHPAPQSVPALSASLEFRHVSFRYGEDLPWILQNVNLKIPAGQCLALIGSNGAGKSTLVKLATRLFDPSEGEILWDGIDIREFDPVELRQRIGVTFQDFMRYDLTVHENIGLGNLAKIDDRAWVQQAAQKANLHPDIMQLPRGYQTRLSRMFAEEGQGIDLSGGQWQKTATARMYAREVDLLILDEPTASLDAKAEYEAYTHFADLTQGCTSILISHRFTTVRMADAIAVLENGQITEYGTHGALLSKSGVYAKWYNMQAECYADSPQPTVSIG